VQKGRGEQRKNANESLNKKVAGQRDQTSGNLSMEWHPNHRGKKMKQSADNKGEGEKSTLHLNHETCRPPHGPTKQTEGLDKSNL